MQTLLLFSGILAVIAVFFKAGERVYLKSQQNKGATEKPDTQSLALKRTVNQTARPENTQG